MWASNKILWFDSAYIKDPSGENLDLDQWTFVGLTLYSLTSRFVLMIYNIFDPLNLGLEFSLNTMLLAWLLEA